MEHAINYVESDTTTAFQSDHFRVDSRVEIKLGAPQKSEANISRKGAPQPPTEQIEQFNEDVDQQILERSSAPLTLNAEIKSLEGVPGSLGDLRSL